MGKALERALWRMYAPHKVKLAVSGCPRNCAESGIKDVGVIAVESGWEIYVAGNGGIKTEVAQFLVKVKTSSEVLEYAGAFLELYRQEGFYLERTVHFVARVGLDYVEAQDRRGCDAGRRALWEQLQFALADEPDPWHQPKRRRRRPAPIRAADRCVMERLGRRLRGLSDIPSRGARVVAARRRDADRRVPHRQDDGVRAARSLPAPGRAAFARPRHRRARRMSAARLDRRARAARRSRRRGLRADVRVEVRRTRSASTGRRPRGGTRVVRSVRRRRTGTGMTAMERSARPARYCGVGCGVRVETAGGRIIGVRGDETHPRIAASCAARAFRLRRRSARPAARSTRNFAAVGGSAARTRVVGRRRSTMPRASSARRSRNAAPIASRSTCRASC